MESKLKSLRNIYLKKSSSRIQDFWKRILSSYMSWIVRTKNHLLNLNLLWSSKEAYFLQIFLQFLGSPWQHFHGIFSSDLHFTGSRSRVDSSRLFGAWGNNNSYNSESKPVQLSTSWVAVTVSPAWDSEASSWGSPCSGRSVSGHHTPAGPRTCPRPEVRLKFKQAIFNF